MDHKNVRGFEFPAFVGDDSDNAFALIFEPKDGEKFMLTMPRSLAASIAEQLTAALQQLAKEGVVTERPTVPELVVRFDAQPMETSQGPAVGLLLEGDRSRRWFYGVQNLQDARSFAALLTAAANPGASTQRKN